MAFAYCVQHGSDANNNESNVTEEKKDCEVCGRCKRADYKRKLSV